MLANRGAYGDRRFFSEETFERLLPTRLAAKYPQLDDPVLEWGIGLSWMFDPAGSMRLNPRLRQENALGPNVIGHSSLSWSIFRVDLDTRRISGMLDAGLGVPDALALAPDGATFATLRLEDAGMLAIALVKHGKPETLVTLKPDEGAPHAIDFSPDGTRLVFDRRKGSSSDLWTLTIATKAWSRLTSDGASSDPVWNGR